MKKLIICSLVLTSLFAQAQDRIIFKNGQLQNAKVLEVGTNNVTYKKAENNDGPNYVVDKSQISVIEYANGTREVMNSYTQADNSSYPSSPQNNPIYSTPAPSVQYVQPRVNVIVPAVSYGYGSYYRHGFGGYGGGFGITYRGGFGHHHGHHRW